MEGLWALTESSCGAGRGEGLVCLILFIYRPPPQLSVARADRPRHSHAWKRRDHPQSRAWQTTQPSVTSQLNIALPKTEKSATGKLLIVKDPFHGSYPDIKVGQTKFCGSVHFGLFVFCAFGLNMIVSD